MNSSRVSKGNILPPSQKNNTKPFEQHGDRYTKLWKKWNSMLWRCNPKNKRHHVWYSDKGIKVCEEWQKYTNFKKWALDNGFDESLTIDRIDENANYCPENCRWITVSENVSRISNNKKWVSVNRYDLNSKAMENFKSIARAKRSIDGSEGDYNKIVQCCKGEIASHKGYRWEYANK